MVLDHHKAEMDRFQLCSDCPCPAVCSEPEERPVIQQDSSSDGKEGKLTALRSFAP